MKKNRQIKKLQNIVFACFFCFAIVFSISIYSFIKLGSVRRESASYNSQLEQLQNQKNKLENEVENMKTDEYIEEQARENLGMIKDGEIKYECTYK